ncbi:nicotinate-nucleotide adenylyltransferase [Franconibacter sp. IITDAS19]|uniref:nicotinate-nucleotide adenylyltransferase n=1 Tax=Franconibacter sp. IITDAS19 TaxID=2930569 RepID=UPI001FFBB7A3|nr:nicotinate-nucleotide adenylyltransferase [Franconibacter sp. IITDAS19]MCK1967237.1 nicotinate-nucleotide adenylyltransferase [Franconibacter sp. IITDAS19]
MANAAGKLQAYYGGTFDPIHYGHLRPVEALAQTVGLERVVIMPNNVPPHRPQPQASSEQRRAMVELAIADNPLFTLDSRELQRETPSYTAETFRQLREEQGETRPLAFIIGQDSLLSLPYWYRYEQLLERCHLLVCRRPGYPVRMQNEEQQRWLEARLTRDIALLHQRPAGQIFLADTPLFDISATDIRHRLAANRPCDEIVPPRVLAYIREHHLYR